MADLMKEGQGVSSIATPFNTLNQMIGGGLRRQFTSVISGPPGNGKSYFVYKCLLEFRKAGHTVYYLPLEYDIKAQMRRIMATYLDDWSLLNDDKKNADVRMEKLINNPDMLDIYKCLESSILNNPTLSEKDANGNIHIPNVYYEDVMEIVTYYSSVADIIIIDPITGIECNPRNGPEHQQQQKFIRSLNALKDNCHYMLVGHTRKRSKHNGKETALTIDDVAGSVAMSRFAQYLMLLDFHDRKQSSVESSFGIRKAVDHTRTLQIGKTNFGPGKGQKIAYDFSSKGPSMTELGWMTGEE
jgi:archaellum biogenesis ATPase FlaH